MTKEEIAAVLAEHKAWRKSNGGKRADLTGSNLSDANLTYARLDGASLSYANLTGVNLTYAKLSYADFTGTSLVGSNLARSNLSGASLYCAYLTGANLTGVNLTGANLTYARLDGAKINDKTVVSILRRATRSDGYEFFLWECEEGYFIKAGCHFLDIEAARQHWTNTHVGKPLGAESLDILDFFDAAINRKGAKS